MLEGHWWTARPQPQPVAARFFAAEVAAAAEVVAEADHHLVCPLSEAEIPAAYVWRKIFPHPEALRVVGAD